MIRNEALSKSVRERERERERECMHICILGLCRAMGKKMVTTIKFLRFGFRESFFILITLSSPLFR